MKLFLRKIGKNLMKFRHRTIRSLGKVLLSTRSSHCISNDQNVTHNWYPVDSKGAGTLINLKIVLERIKETRFREK